MKHHPPDDKLLRRASILLAALLAVLAVALVWSMRSGPDLNAVAGQPVLLDEIVANPTAFKGRQITTICYLWPGTEGLGLSTMPSKDRWAVDRDSGKLRLVGAALSAMADSEWDNGMPLDYLEGSSLAGEKLVVVEGYVFDTGSPDAVTQLEKGPYVRIVRCRTLEAMAAKPSIAAAH